MAVLQTSPVTDTRLVEVSGWDEQQLFFVEKSVLATDDSTGLYISLEHMLAEGAIIFLRAPVPILPYRSNPKAYEAKFLGRDIQGHHQFRLDVARPRYNRDPHSAN